MKVIMTHAGEAVVVAPGMTLVISECENRWRLWLLSGLNYNWVLGTYQDRETAQAALDQVIACLVDRDWNRVIDVRS